MIYWRKKRCVAYSKESNHTPDPQTITTSDPSGDMRRFPGLRPLLITNDLMRDHKLSLFLDPRSFRRWASCHIVKYSIEPYSKTEWEERKVSFEPADTFSREIQGNRMTTGHNETATAWHIPVTGWDDPQRLCIAIVQ
jgi:hypothetical protein